MTPPERVAFITGINGQDGSYLAEHLLQLDYTVYGIIRRMSFIHTQRLDGCIGHPKFQHFYGDVTDSACLLRLLTQMIQTHPNAVYEIYHLAAQSHVKISFEMPEYTAEVDAVGTLRLLNVCKSLKDTFGLEKGRLKFYNACTSEMYGDVSVTVQDETTPFNPQSPYAISKVFAFHSAKNYREAYDMYICNGILFNHESPRRGLNFVTRKVTVGLGKILRGEQQCIEMGNLDAVRDWGHARDFVRGMQRMLQHSEPGDYVLATGESHTVREWIEKTFALRGMPLTWRGEQGTVEEEGVDTSGVVRIKINPKYFRPTEVRYLNGSSQKAEKTFGWRPDISFDDLVAEMVEADAPMPTSDAP